MSEFYEAVGYFDGGCGPDSPGGHGTFGAIVRDLDDNVLHSEAGYIGYGSEMTCNVAEYAGVISVMKFLLERNLQKVVIHGDSDLVVKQMSGKWKAKKGLYLPYYMEAVKLRYQLPHVRFRWIPRELNTEADGLCRQALARFNNLF